MRRNFRLFFKLSLLVAAIYFYILSVLSPSSLWAKGEGWHYDYLGNIGEKGAGLTITLNSPEWDINQKYNKPQIKSVYYFYKESLTDIPLEVKSLIDRDIVLEERDKKGAVIGTFRLTSPKADPHHHYSSNTTLDREVLIGNWTSADGKSNLPVYFNMIQSVAETADGGRCGYGYPAAEKRMQQFYYAVVNKDVKTLKNEFGFVSPSSQVNEKIIKSVPHNLFCNEKGIMLGDGVVWFDSDGNIIAINE